MSGITAPSGRRFTQGDIELARALGKIGFIKYSEQPFKLKSGIESHVYVLGREELTRNVIVLCDLGAKICDAVRERMKTEGDRRMPVFIGLPTAGTPLAQAAATMEYIERGDDAGFYQMRSALKTTHGVHDGWLIGKPDLVEERVFLVDNVVTDGKTKDEMAQRLVEDGLPAFSFDNVILVDRQQGALARMKEKWKEDPIVIFNLLDLTYLFKQLELWPESAVEEVEREITAHQF